MPFDQHVGLNWVELRLKILFCDAISLEDTGEYADEATPLEHLLFHERLQCLDEIAPKCLSDKEFSAYQILRSGAAKTFGDAAYQAGISKMAFSRMIIKLTHCLAEALEC